MEAVLKAFAERFRAAAADKTALRFRAGGTKDFYGNAPRGESFDPRAYTGIVSYEPTELVATVRCGTALSELEAALAERGQMLPFEPPHFANAPDTDATVGGCVAAGLSGPRRMATIAGGAVRDYVLGTSMMNAQGEVLRFGGTVMKNVAGYDVTRLLAGSLGTLGLILDVSLKVLPKPAAEATLRFQMSEADAIARVNEWGGQPIPITATCWHAGLLQLRLSGARAGVQAACARLGGEPVDEMPPWSSLREQTHPFFSAPGPLWRLSVPATTPPLELGDTLIEWGGAQRWVHSNADAALLRARAQSVGGHATLFRAADKSAGAFQPLDAPLRQIHQRLKNEFDPAGIFNPGRMYPDW